MTRPDRRQFVVMAGTALVGTALAGCPDASTGTGGNHGSPAPASEVTTPPRTGETTDASTPGRPPARTKTRTATRTPTATASPTASPTPIPDRHVAIGEGFESDDVAVTVENPRVRKLVAQNAWVAQILRVHEGQYLLVNVTVDDPPESLPLGVSFDGEPPASTEWFVTGRSDTAFPGEDWETYDGVTVALPVAIREGDATVLLSLGDPVVWDLPAEVESALAAAPDFHIDAFAVETAADGAEVTFTVRNTGNRDGIFLARVSHNGIHDASSFVEFEVPVSSRVTHTASPEVLTDDHVFRHATVVTVDSVRDIQREVSYPTATPESTDHDE